MEARLKTDAERVAQNARWHTITAIEMQSENSVAARSTRSICAHIKQSGSRIAANKIQASAFVGNSAVGLTAFSNIARSPKRQRNLSDAHCQNLSRTWNLSSPLACRGTTTEGADGRSTTFGHVPRLTLVIQRNLPHVFITPTCSLCGGQIIGKRARDGMENGIIDQPLNSKKTSNNTEIVFLSVTLIHPYPSFGFVVNDQVRIVALCWRRSRLFSVPPQSVRAERAYDPLGAS